MCAGALSFLLEEVQDEFLFVFSAPADDGWLQAHIDGVERVHSFLAA